MAEGDAGTVGIDLVRRQAQVPDAGQRLYGEGFIEFDDIKIGNRKSGFLQQLPHRRNRADAHDFWFNSSDGVAHQPRQRLEPFLLGKAAFHQHHGCCGIVDSRGVSCGHRTFRIKGGLELAHVLQRHTDTDMLIGVKGDRLFALLDFDGKNLALETTVCNGLCCSTMAFHGVFILFLAADLPTLRDVLASDAHVTTFEGVAQATDERVQHLRVVHARTPA